MRQFAISIILIFVLTTSCKRVEFEGGKEYKIKSKNDNTFIDDSLTIDSSTQLNMEVEPKITVTIIE